MKKSKMFEFFRSRAATNQYFYIRSKIEGQKSYETILNEFLGLENKISHMENAYDEDLVHVSGKTQIVEYGVYDSFYGNYIREEVGE